MKRILFSLAGILASIILNAQAPGTPDTSFGAGGKVLAAFTDGANAYSTASVILPDGRIFLTGRVCLGANCDIFVIGLNVNGSVDDSFGTGGVVTFAFGTQDDFANDIAYDNSGKLLIAGSGEDGTGKRDVAVARINLDGTFDNTFSSDGKLIYSFCSGDDEALAVGLTTDNKIMISGYAQNPSDNNSLVAKFLNDGQFDNTFSSVGYMIYAVGSGFNRASDIITNYDNSFYVLGYYLNSPGYDLFVEKRDITGMPEAWGPAAGGRATFSVGSWDQANAFAKDINDNLFITGYIITSPTQLFVASLNSNGIANTQFGGSGYYIHTNQSTGEDIAIQADGKIVVAGTLFNGTNNDFATMRLNNDGTLDAAFNGTGIRQDAFGTETDDAYSIAIQDDGKIIVAGSSYIAPQNHVAVTRYFSDEMPLVIHYDPGVAPGNIFRQVRDTLPVCLPGSSGADRLWDLTALHHHRDDSMIVGTIDTMVFHENYPGANLSILFKNQLNPDDVYYFNNSSSELVVKGVVSGGTVQGQQVPFMITPKNTLMQYPSTYQSGFNETYNLSAQFYAPGSGFDSIRLNFDYFNSSVIDGWGTVTTPYGSYQALRQRFYQTVYDSSYYLSGGSWTLATPVPSPQKSLTFRWFADTMLFPVVDMGFDSLNNSATWVKYYRPGNISTDLAVNIIQTCSAGVPALFADVSGGTPPYTYSWTSDPAGFTSSEQNPTINPVLTTTYYLTVTDYIGSVAVSQINVTVPADPPTAGPDVSACPGEPVTLTAANGTGYSWSTGAATASVTVNPLSTTSYTVTITLTTMCQVVDTVVVTLEPQVSPAVFAAGPTTFCYGDSVMLYAPAGTGYSYQWYLNGAMIAGAVLPFYQAKQAGLFYVVIHDGIHCFGNSDTIVVTMNPVDFNLAFSSIPNPPIFTTPNSGNDFNVLFHNDTPVPSGYTFIWNYGDNTADTILQNDHYYHYNGWYSVSLIAVSNTTGCVDTLTKADFVGCAGGLLNPCTLDPVISYSGSPFMCNGDSIMLTANTGSGITYQWIRNGVMIPGAEFFTYYATQNGDYRVIETNTSCTVASGVASVSYYPQLQPQVLVSGALPACSSDSVELSVSAWFPSYNWSTGQVTQNIFVSNGGYYQVTATDIYGCNNISTPCFVNSSLIDTPRICMALVDSTTGKNKIVWESAVTGDAAYYNIYKLIAGQGYQVIGSVAYNALSMFTDTASHPMSNSEFYKLSAVDTCGNESALSDYHRTLHLSVSQGFPAGVELNWQDNYYGFAYDQYNLYRYLNNGIVELFVQLPFGTTSYSDLNPPADVIWYCVAAVKPGTPCVVSGAKEMAGPFSQSLSNIEDNVFVKVTKNDFPEPCNFSVFPNPAGKVVSLHYHIDQAANITISLYNPLGSEIACLYSEKNDAGNHILKLDLDEKGISTGVYFISLDNGLVKQFKKIAVSK